MGSLTWSETLVEHNHKGGKIAIYLVIGLYPIFGVLDYFVMPTVSLTYSYVSRTIVVALSICTLFLLSIPIVKKRAELITAFYMYLVGLGICLMTWMMSGLESSYYAGIMLVMIGSGLLYAWSPKTCIAVHGGLWLTWFIPNFALHPVLSISACISNILFLSATAVIVTVGQVTNYRRLNQEYTMRQRLKSTQHQLDVVYQFNHISRYKLFDLLGEGGHGQVYMAYDYQLKTKRAIKIINLPSTVTSEESQALVDRLAQAARTTQELSQLTRNVVQVFDIQMVVEQPPLYIVMEYLEGKTLKEHLRLRDLSARKLFMIMKLLFKTMAIAHQRGVVHRDLKPDNIMIIPDPNQGVNLKVLDFDLVKIQYSSVKTQIGQILGTLEYMAPEQLKGLNVDARADVFSLGAILYECFSGVRANRGTTQRELISTLLVSGVQPLQEVAPHLPVELCKLTDQCLSLDPMGRFAHAGALHAELQEIDPSTLK